MRNPARRWLSRRAAIGPGCWNWIGFCDRDGYGRTQLMVGDKKEQMAHRVSFIRCRGPIPDGLVVMHRCDNPSCIRPTHLVLGTQPENIYDMIAKGRHGPAHGEANHFARLRASQVTELRMRRANGEDLNVLAAEFGIAPITASQIVRRHSWRSVP
jgi:hypothetical protein